MKKKVTKKQQQFPPVKDPDPIFPQHYKANGVECIDVIEALGHGYDFCIGSALKYLFRVGQKPNATTIEDLKKAAWYIERAIKEVER